MAGASLVAVSGCLSRLPGATGPRNPPNEARERPSSGDDGVLSVSSTDVAESESGALVVTGEVTNRSDAEANGTVVAEATVDGDTTSASASVTVPGNGAADFRVVVPVRYTSFNDGGSLSVTVA